MCLKNILDVMKNLQSKERAAGSIQSGLNVVAYIDLLGMSNFTRKSTEDAIEVFDGYNTILRDKIVNGMYSSNDDTIQRLLNRASATSFDYFLPFSDSIFLASANPDGFVEQLGSFVLDCYVFNANAYRKKLNAKDPFASKMLCLGGGKKDCKRYPILFRGAVSCGSVHEGTLLGIAKGKSISAPVLLGEPVVAAVKMEGKAKGPRLIIDERSYRQLSHFTKRFIREVDLKEQQTGRYYEVLWPAYHFIEQNGESELGKVEELLTPAANLWKAFNHTEYGPHYFALIDLIVAGALAFANVIGLRNDAKAWIERILDENGLSSKKEILLKV